MARGAGAGRWKGATVAAAVVAVAAGVLGVACGLLPQAAPAGDYTVAAKRHDPAYIQPVFVGKVVVNVPQPARWLLQVRGPAGAFWVEVPRGTYEAVAVGQRVRWDGRRIVLAGR